MLFSNSISMSISYCLLFQFVFLQVQDATKARLVFLVSVLIESEEMVIHVIGEEILDRELRFLVSVFVTKIFYKIKKKEKKH